MDIWQVLLHRKWKWITYFIIY